MAGETRDRWRSTLLMAFAGCLGLALVALWLSAFDGHPPAPSAGTQVLLADDNGPDDLDLAAPDHPTALIAGVVPMLRRTGGACRSSPASHAVAIIPIRVGHLKIPTDEDPPSVRS